MRRPINLACLSPLRRGLVLGYRAAHHKCRAELARQAANFDAELVALQQEFCAIAREVHKDRLIRATEEALGERALNPGMLLH